MKIKYHLEKVTLTEEEVRTCLAKYISEEASIKVDPSDINMRMIVGRGKNPSRIEITNKEDSVADVEEEEIIDKPTKKPTKKPAKKPEAKEEELDDISLDEEASLEDSDEDDIGDLDDFAFDE